MSSTPALSIESIVKNYGPLRALDGVSFDVAPGEVFGLLGPNGAGKTSLISIVVTLETPTAGRARVFGHDVTTHPRQAKVNTGWVPQEIINHGFFSVAEILKFHAGYFGLSDCGARLEYILKGLSLWEHRHKKVKQLSGGMKRRLMIAKGLIHEPGLLLLDEPTAGVDVELRLRLWDFVEELKGQGLSILLTTHYLEEAERLCDRVAIINKGKIRAMGQTRQLIEEWSRKKIVLRVLQPLDKVEHPALISGSGTEWTFLVEQSKTLGALLQELKFGAAQLADVQVTDGNLEDVFVRLTKEENA